MKKSHTLNVTEVLHVFYKFLIRENNVTPSNTMEMKIDITKQTKMSSEWCFISYASRSNNLSYIKSLDFTIGFLGDCLIFRRV